MTLSTKNSSINIYNLYIIYITRTRVREGNNEKIITITQYH